MAMPFSIEQRGKSPRQGSRVHAVLGGVEECIILELRSIISDVSGLLEGVIAMNIQELVGYINATHTANFVLQGKYATGENQGAYALSDDTGAGYVLKWNTRPPWLRSIHRAQQITNHLLQRGMPVPTYILADTRADGVTYWVQTALIGSPPEELLLSHAEQLLHLIDLQEAQALASGSNWSEYVRAVVFARHSGWEDTLAGYSDDTRTVLTRLKRLVARKEHVTLRSDDICHGDMGVDNVLVDGNQVSGIVDWDAGGDGDRALDLSILLFDSYHAIRIRHVLHDRIVKISGTDAYCMYLAYNILGRLDWSIRHHAPEAVIEGVAHAHHMLADAEAFC
jgi:aminoglycoside phosphotransferase